MQTKENIQSAASTVSIIWNFAFAGIRDNLSVILCAISVCLSSCCMAPLNLVQDITNLSQAQSSPLKNSDLITQDDPYVTHHISLFLQKPNKNWKTKLKTRSVCTAALGWVQLPWASPPIWRPRPSGPAGSTGHLTSHVAHFLEAMDPYNLFISMNPSRMGMVEGRLRVPQKNSFESWPSHSSQNFSHLTSLGQFNHI